MVQKGMRNVFKMWKAIIWKKELDLLYGLPRALRTGVLQGHMIGRGISIISLPICRLGFRARRSTFYWVILQIGTSQASWVLINISYWGRERLGGLDGAWGWGNRPGWGNSSWLGRQLTHGLHLKLLMGSGSIQVGVTAMKANLADEGQCTKWYGRKYSKPDGHCSGGSVDLH